METYTPSTTRYENNGIPFFPCGSSGLKLPKFSFGLWHNFGDIDNHNEALKMLTFAFDNGITHFDLANNYGTPAGSAEVHFGKILKDQFANHRDELIISTKAGHRMWQGPYGDGGSRKSLMASIDQSLKRMGIDYVDIFYSHRYDSETPLEETMNALSDIVKQGKALYVGLSKYPSDKLPKACELLRKNGTPCLVYQERYSIFNRKTEFDTIPTASENQLGVVTFSPLAQGLLSTKYLHGIPEQSRAALPYGFLRREQVTPEKIRKILQLNELATKRGQTLSQMALAWCARNQNITSVLLGASSTNQLKENIRSLDNPTFSNEELQTIDKLSE